MSKFLSKSDLTWTEHAKKKRKYYQLSKTRVLKALREPDREEKGIASGTIACMKKAGTKKNPWEIWVMYEEKDNKKKIVSVWRYPGESPKGEAPIPEEVKQEVEKPKNN